MKLRASPDALVAHLEGEAVLLHAGTKEYFRLNETGQVVWRLIEAGADVDAIVARLLAEFSVDAATARTEAGQLLEQLVAAGLVETDEGAGT